MKVPLLFFLVLFSSAATLFGQGPFSTDEALKQLYNDYDPATKTAQWECTKEQQSKGMHTGWPCTKEDSTVAVSVILMAQVQEGETSRLYIVTSAKPAHDPMGEYNCHACAPAIGAAVFIWIGPHWELESSNAAIEFSGGWGDPPSVDFIALGPQKHGLLLWTTDLAQGFSSSSKELLAPIGKSINVIWSIGDEDDNLGSFDPDETPNHPIGYRSSAAFRFLSGDDGAESRSIQRNYYDIEVISRGFGQDDSDRPITPENWTEIYTFRNGKYTLLRRTVFAEIKKPAKTPAK